MRYVLLGNPIQEWATALAVAFACAVLLIVIRTFLIHRLDAAAERTETRVDDWLLRMMRNTYSVFIVILALYLGSLMLEFPKKYEVWLWRVAVTTMLIQAAIWGDTGVRVWRKRYRQAAIGGTDSVATAASTAIIDFILRMIVWVVFTLMILDNLGFNITTLVASLGIGGIAVALAVQNILGDLLASLSIVLDKPFVVGDFIIVGEQLGTVEYIGLKTTRLRGLGGDQIIFSNGDILKARIGNQTRMFTRRAAFILRIRYGTPPDKLAAVPQMVKDIILGQESTASFERAHLRELGEWSINYEVVYWIKSPDYFVFMDTQQEVLLNVIRGLAERGIEIAYPTRIILRPPEDCNEGNPPLH
ncbi:small-conductance mechanosensitive channel [Pseudoduganella flava]|uniref:Mechanosensitive ion channel n=1 Tax=Pseudoduganella flava TaxID=871742 RepID=A0A562PLG8_9BURK|nr:mechanosensitive ion channel family protein [Pseudoduganella flava]QGZ41031.1 mechanosensitive ion channel [Pseudoduganella flava]TWI45274.1 small-conductance mechanosensitive channel [Pseudoduganella flava]